MKQTSNINNLTEYKVLILYILNKIQKPISNDEFLNLVLNVTDMNYFYFYQFLLELLEDKYIYSEKKDDYMLYSITDFGKETLELTQDIIPGITKLKIDSNYKPTYESFKNKQSIVAEYIPKKDNCFDVSCKIIEDNDIIFEVKAFAGSSENAKKIIDNWKKNANNIYPQILKIITVET